MKKYFFPLFLGGTFILMMAFPVLASIWDESLLLSGFIPRPVLEGQLAGEAQESPIVYGLYCKRVLSGNDINGSCQEVNSETQARVITERLDELGQAGVIPDVAMEQARHIFCTSRAKTYILEQDGMKELIYQGYDEEENIQTAIVAEHSRTGLVTSCSVTGVISEGDVLPLLEAYRSYLGLDGLSDWEIRELERSVICWSVKGQIYLSCTFQNQRFYIGAVSMGEDELKSIAEKFS